MDGISGKDITSKTENNFSKIEFLTQCYRFIDVNGDGNLEIYGYKEGAYPSMKNVKRILEARMGWRKLFYSRKY